MTPLEVILQFSWTTPLVCLTDIQSTRKEKKRQYHTPVFIFSFITPLEENKKSRELTDLKCHLTIRRQSRKLFTVIFKIDGRFGKDFQKQIQLMHDHERVTFLKIK